MTRYSILSALVLLSLAASLSGANIRFETRSEPTPGLPGSSTYTLRAISDQLMQGFDFAGDGSNRAPFAKGFFGHMNQLKPAGQSTIYSDNNPIITALGGNPKQDSQFLVRTGDVVVPAGFAEESGFHLQGIWAHSAPVGAEFDIAQLVVPNFSPIFFRGVITTREGNSIVENSVSGRSLLPNELPPQVVDSTVNAVANIAVIHTFTASDAHIPPEFIGWSNFVFNGPGTAIQPTFDPETQAFRWDTTGSRLGTYTAMVTAWNFFSLSDTGTLTIHLVPEPASVTLFGLMAVGWILLRRRNGII
jgi:hypothetical protein